MLVQEGSSEKRRKVMKRHSSHNLWVDRQALASMMDMEGAQLPKAALSTTQPRLRCRSGSKHTGVAQLLSSCIQIFARGGGFVLISSWEVDGGGRFFLGRAHTIPFSIATAGRQLDALVERPLQPVGDF